MNVRLGRYWVLRGKLTTVQFGRLEPLRTRNLTEQIKFLGSQVNYGRPCGKLASQSVEDWVEIERLPFVVSEDLWNEVVG